ncbi:helix-turn-helix domain-containing protein [Candidatus Roizmanbacteria bacterium]|nr:helix-turn-helix domain-containing protein [Candidatus Roizmanbacteria bacterium]
MNITKVYTPEQVAEMLQLSKNTVYDLIGKGEIIAKRIGSVYRIPASSISFVFTGLDYDLYVADKEDAETIKTKKIQENIRQVRKELYK